MSTLPDPSDVIRFTFELGQLRQERRRGWLRIFEDPESVAEHSHRAACLGYILAHLEGYADPHEVATMILFHDIHEARMGDPDLVKKHAVTPPVVKTAEDNAIRGQVAPLDQVGQKILEMWKAVDTQSTPAGIIAKDAEKLEMAFTAREVMIRGNADAKYWLETLTPLLKTSSAKTLLSIVTTADPCEWWKRVCGLTERGE
jgi:putative hydrolase of HD superfamily